MSGLDPSGPSQPTMEDGYEASGNAVTKEPYEHRQGNQATESDSSNPRDHRVPQEQSTSSSDATPSSLGYGVRGAPAGEEAKGYTEEDVGRHRELDGEQMAAPGEGKVWEAVAGGEDGRGKTGASGGEQGMEMDLDRKKDEQRGEREEIMGERRKEVNVGGVLGQRSAPADATEKGGYPNSGN